MKTIDTDTVPVEWLDPNLATILDSFDPGIHAFESDSEPWEIELGDRVAIALWVQQEMPAEVLSMIMSAQLAVKS